MSVSDWLPWSRRRRTDELADELRAHLAMATTDRIARGESPADAAAAANREFGNAALVQEISRDQWGRAGRWLENLGQDVRFAVRTLRRARGFAVTAILTIALSVGATTAIFSVAYATLVHPLPFPNPGQLVRIEDDLLGLGGRNVGMSTPEWHDLQRSGIFEHVSPTWYDDNNLTGVSRPQRVSMLIVATNYFALLGVQPELGTAFDPADATPGFNGELVISDGLWHRAFGGDSSAIGRVIQMDSDSYRIVGVAPRGFQAPEDTRIARGTDVWVAFGFAGPPMSANQPRVPLFPGATARLAPGLTLQDAQRRVDVLVDALRRQYPADYPASSEWKIRLVSLQAFVVGDVRPSILLLFGAVALVLLIACTNVANLLLTRATARAREMAVRQAIGGAPARVTRQLLTEGIVLSLLGGAVAVALLLAMMRSLVRFLPDSVPQLNAIAIDWSVLLFAFGASVLAGAFFGLAPALHVRRLDVSGVLKKEGRGSTSSREQSRTRRSLVVMQFALSLMLMVAASLLARSFWELLHAPLGFDPSNVAIVHTRLPYPNEKAEDLYKTAADEAPFARELVRRVGSIPGVSEVALASGGAVPLDHPLQDQDVLRVVFEGRDDAGRQPPFISGAEVTPEFFHLLRMPIVLGRALNTFDTHEAPSVAVINEAMARAYWPNEDPLGKRIRISSRDSTWTSVVGVVANARTETLASAAVPQIYVSLYQRKAHHLAVFVRGHFETGTLGDQVRVHVQALNSALPVFGAETLSDAVSASLADRKFAMEMIALFAVTALLLAALGIYGVISYIVAERTHEIGVRVALGARPEEVMRMVLRQGLGLALAGAGVGIAGALLVSRTMAGLVYGVSATDPLTIVAVTAVLTAIALAACYLPGRRAIRVDPMEALRY